MAESAPDPSLRQAMRDPRYWNPAHPDHAAYAAQLWRSWQASQAGPKDSTRAVAVRAYERDRNGRHEHLGGYVQARHARGERATPRPVSAPAPVPSTPPPAQARPQLTIFVGGAADRVSRIMQNVADAARDDPRASHGETAYFSHDQTRAILARVQTAPPATRIVLVGHSWGGDTVAVVAARLGETGHPVDLLVTADPVGWTSPDFLDRVRRGTREWINLHAVGGDRWSRSNLVGALGGRYGEAPRAFATGHLALPLDHADLAGMLRAAIGGRSLADRMRRE